MSFCTITYDRGDRPQFLDFCKYQLSRMTVKPDQSYFITHQPKGKEIDLIPRVKKGIELAKADGFEEIFFIESDDYYPADYFETMSLDNHDFIGSLVTTYYHIKDKRYSKIDHSARSSLFTTGLNLHVLDSFNWPPKTAITLDVSLWNHAQQFKRKFIYTKAVGIKHGYGLCAGIGHRRTLKQSDENMEWLKSRVDSEAFQFYKTVRL